MSENRIINIYNLCYNTVVLKKIGDAFLKIALLQPYFRQKQGHHEPHPKTSSIFLKLTRGDHRLSYERTFDLSKYYISSD